MQQYLWTSDGHVSKSVLWALSELLPEDDREEFVEITTKVIEGWVKQRRDKQEIVDRVLTELRCAARCPADSDEVHVDISVEAWDLVTGPSLVTCWALAREVQHIDTQMKKRRRASHTAALSSGP